MRRSHFALSASVLLILACAGAPEAPEATPAVAPPAPVAEPEAPPDEPAPPAVEEDGCCAMPHWINMDATVYTYGTRAECEAEEDARWHVGPECEPVCCEMEGGGLEEPIYSADVPRGSCAYFCCGHSAVIVDEARCVEAEAAAPSATELNNLAHRQYEEGDYGSASETFREAIEVDPEHTLAHYNLACTLALLNASGVECPWGATEREALAHLARSIELDEGRRTRMRSDSDLDEIRDSVWYGVLDGADLSTAAGVESVASRSYVRLPHGMATLTLAPDGTATLERREGLVQVVSGEETTLSVVRPKSGTWEAVDGGVALTLSGETTTYDLSAEGDLVEDKEPRWSSLWSDCP